MTTANTAPLLGADVALPLSEAWPDPLDERATGGRKYAKHLRFHELKI